MSELLIGSNPDDVTQATTLPQTDEEKARQLPVPQGYRMLCALPEAEDKFDSGILKSTDTMRNEEVLSTVFFVVAVSYTHLRAHETPEHLVCRLLLEKKK